MTEGEKGLRNLARLVWFAIPLVFVSVFFLIGWVYAAEVQLEVQFRFNTNQVPAKTVESYRLSKDGAVIDTIPVADITDNRLTVLAVDAPAGPGDFTLAAIYTDQTESPESAVFPYSVPVVTVMTIVDMQTNIVE